MSEPFVGEIRMFAGNFAPQGWAYCDGQLLAVSQNDALFSLLGTIYGGDGRTTFGLPDMRGRIPIHPGTGTGLTSRKLGAKGGGEKETVTVNQLPSHTHRLAAIDETATEVNPQGRMLGRTVVGVSDIYNNVADPCNMNAAEIGALGGSQSHTNLQPFLCVHFIIALFGIYPSRN